MIGIGVGVETEARDSRIIVPEMLEGVKALGLSGGKLSPDNPVLAGPVCCSRCCHSCSPWS